MDNVILTQEVIHIMRRKKGKKGLMPVKLDLHEAYNNLSWSFLENTLSDFGFPRKIINLIMFSVKESCITILWNGQKLNPFKPERGLRQRDPLAPYLFILALEKLSWAIQQEVENKKWAPISLSRGGTKISHLFFFTDDLILFGEGTNNQIQETMHCIETFSKLSGLNVNLSKSMIFCFPNTSCKVKKRIGDVAGIPMTENLGWYLGIPILHERVNKSTFSYILEKMKRKLANWTSESLSLAGKQVLVQLALASIPVYTMQAVALLIKTCNDIDKICRDFLWEDRDDKKRIHLVNWVRSANQETKGD